MFDLDLDIETCASEGPQSALERQLIIEYLKNRGYQMEDLHNLPAEEAKSLMREACIHAALKLAEVESKAKFRKVIKAPL